MGKKIYKLTIEPLTCVHIGTGNGLTLLDYTVKEIKPGKNLYMKFSSDSILNRIAGDAGKAHEFEVASLSANMKSIQTFFQKNFSIDDDLEYPCETTNEFSEIYSLNKEKDPYENAALVEQIYRPKGKKTPVIPGSSIKGAVRTAVLNDLLSNLDDDTYNKYIEIFDNKIEKNSENPKKLENELNRLNTDIQKELLSDYKDAKDDPFRAIEFSDCSFIPKNSQIVGVLKTVSKNQQSKELFISNSTQIQVEAIKGSLMAGNETGQGLLRLNVDLMNQRNGVSKALNIKDIVRSCNYFYWREFENEYNKFYEGASQHCDLITSLKEKLKEIKSKDNQFIIRVGRWSQVEFVTLEENLRAPQNSEYGTTRTVFNYDGQYLPLGWCKCSIEEIKD